MCGRFAQKATRAKITKKFKVEEVPPLTERYNVAPAQVVLGIRESSGGRDIVALGERRHLLDLELLRDLRPRRLLR